MDLKTEITIFKHNHSKQNISRVVVKLHKLIPKLISKFQIILIFELYDLRNILTENKCLMISDKNIY